MTDGQVGRIIRAIRRRRRWRQVDLAAKADVPQSVVSLTERGFLDRVSLPVLRRICAALEIELSFLARWHGPELQKLLDADHARIVEYEATLMARFGWTILPEFTFNHYGERGSVDLVGWHAERRALVLNEIKTQVVDQQDLLASNGRKCRIVPEILGRERGWRPASVGNVLVLMDTATNRRTVAAHATTFGANFPERSHAVRRWLAHPDGPLAGLWFLSPSVLGDGRQARVGSARVRVRKRGSDDRLPSVDQVEPDRRRLSKRA